MLTGTEITLAAIGPTSPFFCRKSFQFYDEKFHLQNYWIILVHKSVGLYPSSGGGVSLVASLLLLFHVDEFVGWLLVDGDDEGDAHVILRRIKLLDASATSITCRRVPQLECEGSEHICTYRE